jgi:polar amino acid transport system substrate-binding protein/cystine transport system substrate-binding protein/membrane-bound lytic murein transglycosylase F
VELLRGVAQQLGVSLVTVENPVMGKDFNPRAWRVTRAQCEVLAGGVVGSAITRSFLETSPAYATTGWAWLSPRDDGTLQGRRVGVLVGISGLDRVSLAAYLRAAKARVTVTLDANELVQGLKDGRFDIGITERLLADTLAGRMHWSVGWTPPALTRYPVVLGLWKGDLTLKRAILSAMERMRRSGALSAIITRYVPQRSFIQQNIANDSSGRTN